jgi:hypothetical protein
VVVNGKGNQGYFDKDKVLKINYVQSTIPYCLVEGFGIGHNKDNTTISAEGLGDENTIVYYKADLSRGGSTNYDEGYTHANSDGTYAYHRDMNCTFCKFIAYIPASSAIQKGDVNVDGEVTIADVVMMVNYILGSTDNAANVLKYGDMDDSGEVNISDVVALVNKILE